MSMLEEHPHLVRLKQVLYAPQRLYLVTGVHMLFPPDLLTHWPYPWSPSSLAHALCLCVPYFGSQVLAPCCWVSSCVVPLAVDACVYAGTGYSDQAYCMLPLHHSHHRRSEH